MIFTKGANAGCVSALCATVFSSAVMERVDSGVCLVCFCFCGVFMSGFVFCMFFCPFCGLGVWCSLIVGLSGHLLVWTKVDQPGLVFFFFEIYDQLRFGACTLKSLRLKKIRMLN